MEPRKHLPPYNVALGASEATLVAPPPFNFPRVTARVFPLRASLNILSGFCQRYLNVARSICEFQPYLPYVLLVVLDYGRMAIEESNMGWVSQHEVFFEVPLGMWSRDRWGRRKFVKWVVNTPFIVVDNPASLTTGREVYGWPKVLATLRYNPESWLIDPRNPLRLLTLDVKGLNCEEPDVPLLEIDQQVDQNAALVPPDLGLLDPLQWVFRLSRGVWGIGCDLAQILVGSPLSGFGGQTPGDRREVLFGSLRELSGFYRKPGLDVVTLKQFRDAQEPNQICYQALVESQLSINRYNRGGLLGLYNLLQGDLSGGFRISLHQNPAFSIVESLGLEVAWEQSFGGHTVSVLEPFFPFWMSVDLTYGRGKTLCWRMRDEPWYRKGTRIPDRPSQKARTSFNTFAGAAAQVWRGPFVLPEAGFDIFPLPARREHLERFLKDYLSLDAVNAPLSDGEKFSFELVGHHVYMAATRSRIFSLERSAASIEACQIGFYVPILLEQGRRCELVLATPFAFVNNPTLAMTMREVQGVPAMDASIDAPSRFWENDGPLLTMHLDVFTALDAGLGSERRKLLEVMRGAAAPPSRHGGSPLPALKSLLKSLLARACGPVALSRLMLKQFRDAASPNRACYQALILEPLTLSKPGPIQRLEGVTAVHVYRYPSLPLVETLGLQCDLMVPEEIDGTLADVLHPEDPFRIELDIEIGLGEVLSRAAGLLPWRIPSMAGLRQRKGTGIEKILADYDLAGSGLQPVIQALLDQRAGGGA
jgi:hypothetical protein